MRSRVINGRVESSEKNFLNDLHECLLLSFRPWQVKKLSDVFELKNFSSLPGRPDTEQVYFFPITRRLTTQNDIESAPCIIITKYLLHLDRRLHSGSVINRFDIMRRFLQLSTSGARKVLQSNVSSPLRQVAIPSQQKFDHLFGESSRIVPQSSCRLLHQSTSGGGKKKGGLWNSLTGRGSQSPPRKVERSRPETSASSGSRNDELRTRVSKQQPQHDGNERRSTKQKRKGANTNKPPTSRGPHFEDQNLRVKQDTGSRQERSSRRTSSARDRPTTSNRRTSSDNSASSIGRNIVDSVEKIGSKVKTIGMNMMPGNPEPNETIEPEVVLLDQNKQRFVLDLGNGKVARIDYNLVEDGDGGSNLIEMYHTEVPEDMRGQGIGKALARGAFEIARDLNIQCRLTCDYLIDYARRFATESERQCIVDA